MSPVNSEVKNVKVSIIGAGSMTFIASIVRDLALTESLHGITLSLMDVSPQRLERSYSLAKRYFSETNAPINIEKTTDLRECIKDSLFVLNLAFAIGYTNLGIMIETGEKHGYYRGIDATVWNMVNPYPTLTAFKQYMVANKIAKIMEEQAPDAWLIQISNPVLEISTLLHRAYPKLKIIGYCHGAEGGTKLLTTMLLDLNFDEVEWQAAGLNHVIFLTKFKYKGEKIYNLIDDWIENKAEEFWRTYVPAPWQETVSRAAVDMYKFYGLYPIGDTARSGTWKYHRDLKTKQYWYGPLGGIDSEIGWALRLLLNQQNEERLDKAAFDPNVKVTSIFPPVRSGEHIVDFIDSVVNKVERRIILNIPNEFNALPKLPSDLVVETPAYVLGENIRPEPLEPIPRIIYTRVFYPRIEVLEWSLEAFLAGSKDLLIDALMRDPRTRSNNQAEETIEAILNLPFNQDMKQHYK
ncbi:MAG: alpha-glucosidase/alpha-galactosidase [Candidatus Bathyarchaeia archaeon]